MPPQNIQHPLNGFDVTLVWIFDIDKDVIQINNDKEIELLGQDFINVTLEARWCIR